MGHAAAPSLSDDAPIEIAGADPTCLALALLLGALAVGRSTVETAGGIDAGAPVVGALRAFGARVAADGAGGLRIDGLGVGGLLRPAGPIDLGADAAGLLLVAGAVAGQPMPVSLTTAESAPADDRIALLRDGLAAAGAEVAAERRGAGLDLSVRGAAVPLPVDHGAAPAPAAVAVALLLAGLAAPGRTTVAGDAGPMGAAARLLAAFGAAVDLAKRPDGALSVEVEGRPELRPRRIRLVFGDPVSDTHATGMLER